MVRTFVKLQDKLIFIASSLLLSVPLFFNLGFDYVNVDQELWLKRSHNFYSSIRTFDFSQTYQQYHPGVTVMYLVGLGKGFYSIFRDYPVDYADMSEEEFPIFNFFVKLPLVFVIFLLLMISKHLLKKMFGTFFSLAFIILLVFEPFYLANLRNLHLDGILSVFLLTSVVVLSYALVKKNNDMISISGILFGLALLTKISSLLAAPGILLLFTYYYFSRKEPLAHLKSYLLNYFASAILIFFILFPAMWVGPVSTLEKIFKKGAFDTALLAGHTHYVNGLRLRNPGADYYLKVIAFRSSPELSVMYILIPFSAILYLRLKSKSGNTHFSHPLFLTSFLTGLLYLLFLSLVLKKTDRYLTPYFPFLFLTLTFFLNFIFRIAKEKLQLKSPIFMALPLFVLVTIKISQFFSVEPDFFGYYNPLLGGVERAKRVLYLNQGGTGMNRVADFFKARGTSPEAKIGTFEPWVLDVWLDADVQGLKTSKKGTYDYVIKPQQRGEEYIIGYRRIGEVRVGNIDYWKIYQKK